MASATDHIDHVRTQLPYALLAAGLALGDLRLAGALDFFAIESYNFV